MSLSNGIKAKSLQELMERYKIDAQIELLSALNDLGLSEGFIFVKQDEDILDALKAEIERVKSEVLLPREVFDRLMAAHQSKIKKEERLGHEDVAETKEKSLNDLKKHVRLDLQIALLTSINELCSNKDIFLSCQEPDLLDSLRQHIEKQDKSADELLELICSNYNVQANKMIHSAAGTYRTTPIHMRGEDAWFEDHDMIRFMPLSYGNVEVLTTINRADASIWTIFDALFKYLNNPSVHHIIIPIGPGHYRCIYITKPNTLTERFEIELFGPFGSKDAAIIQNFALRLFTLASSTYDRLQIRYLGERFLLTNYSAIDNTRIESLCVFLFNNVLLSEEDRLKAIVSTLLKSVDTDTVKMKLKHLIGLLKVEFDGVTEETSIEDLAKFFVDGYKKIVPGQMLDDLVKLLTTHPIDGIDKLRLESLSLLLGAENPLNDRASGDALLALQFLCRCEQIKGDIELLLSGPCHIQQDTHSCGDHVCAQSHKKMKEWGVPDRFYDERLVSALDAHGNNDGKLRQLVRTISANPDFGKSVFTDPPVSQCVVAKNTPEDAKSPTVLQTNELKSNTIRECPIDEHLALLHAKADDLMRRAYVAEACKVNKIYERLSVAKTQYMANPAITLDMFCRECLSIIDTADKEGLDKHRGIGAVVNSIIAIINSILGLVADFKVNQKTTSTVHCIEGLSASLSFLFVQRRMQDEGVGYELSNEESHDSSLALHLG